MHTSVHLYTKKAEGRLLAVRCIRAQDGLRLLRFHGIEGFVGRVEKRPNGVGVLRITGNSHANRKHGFLSVSSEKLANSPRNQRGGDDAGLRQDHGKFVPAVARGGVNRTTAVFEDLPQPAERAVAGLMRIPVVDVL